MSDNEFGRLNLFCLISNIDIHVQRDLFPSGFKKCVEFGPETAILRRLKPVKKSPK